MLRIGTVLSASWRENISKALTKRWNHFGNMRYDFPIHFRHFKSIHVSVRYKGITTDLKYDVLSFIRFVLNLGPIPPALKKKRLSIGRKNHKLGYEDGNYAWQSLSDNDREQWNRVLPHLKRKPESIKRLANEGRIRLNRLRGETAKTLRKLWRDPVWRRKTIAAQNLGRRKKQK